MPTEQLEPIKAVQQETLHRSVEIRPFASPQDAEAFRSLNEEWIKRHFVLEAKDIETLGDPEGTILRKGGRVLLAYRAEEPVGCVALIPIENGVYELSKMAVSPRVRGQGIGRKLLLAALAEARAMGVVSLFLGSSTKLADAVHLYEAVGFRHVSPGELPPMPYARADVFMQMRL
jgi:putative acetyltransferase